MLIQAAASGLGAASGRPMLIAHELERRVLVPLFDRQQKAPERCCLITTAASRQRPELRAFRDWILSEAALPPPAAPGLFESCPGALHRLSVDEAQDGTATPRLTASRPAMTSNQRRAWGNSLQSVSYHSVRMTQGQVATSAME